VFFILLKSSLLGSTYGASACARTAVDAGILVDYVLVLALGNCVNGALVSTCTACDAIIINLISHFFVHPFGIL
jgi:hypothetical protein